MLKAYKACVCMKKKVCRNWDMVLAFIVLEALSLIPGGDLIVSLLMIALCLPLVALACRWVYAPLGLFTKTEYADGVATVTNILHKKVQTVDLNNAAYIYKIRKIMPFLVASNEPLSSKQEALAAYKAGMAGFVIMQMGDALYPYEKKAETLK